MVFIKILVFYLYVSFPYNKGKKQEVRTPAKMYTMK